VQIRLFDGVTDIDYFFFRMRESQKAVPSHRLDANGELIVREKHERRAAKGAVVVESSPSQQSPERKKTRGCAQRSLEFQPEDVELNAPALPSNVTTQVDVSGEVGNGFGVASALDLDESQSSVVAVASAVALPPASQLQPPGAVVTEAEADDWIGQAMLLFQASECTCSVLAKQTVKQLHEFAKTRRPKIPHRRGGAELRKKEQLLEICRACKTVDEVATAMGGAGYHQGVAPEYWYPVIDRERLTVFTAVHLAFRRAGEGEGFSAILNEFRAHFLKVIKVNWRFYVVRGKVNKAGEVGQSSVFSFAEKLTHFLSSLTSAINHYRDNHSDMTCGRLRKYQTCVLFQIFQRCDPMVERIVVEIVNTLVLFALENNIETIDNIYPDQEKLKRAFNLL
jgi:hypothetical protein